MLYQSNFGLETYISITLYMLIYTSVFCVFFFSSVIFLSMFFTISRNVICENESLSLAFNGWDGNLYFPPPIFFFDGQGDNCLIRLFSKKGKIKEQELWFYCLSANQSGRNLGCLLSLLCSRPRPENDISATFFSEFVFLFSFFFIV